MRLCRAELLFPLLLIASCETTSPEAISGSAAKPRFEQHTCTIPNVDATLAARMRCGTVRVPRDYAHPDGPSFALSVVVIESEQKPALPDPVVYINGGPGEPITVYAAAQAKTPYASGTRPGVDRSARHWGLGATDLSDHGPEIIGRHFLAGGGGWRFRSGCSTCGLRRLSPGSIVARDRSFKLWHSGYGG